MTLRSALLVMFRGDLGAGQDNPEIVLRLEREGRGEEGRSDGSPPPASLPLRLPNRFGLRLDRKTPPRRVSSLSVLFLRCRSINVIGIASLLVWCVAVHER